MRTPGRAVVTWLVPPKSVRRLKPPSFAQNFQPGIAAAWTVRLPVHHGAGSRKEAAKSRQVASSAASRSDEAEQVITAAFSGTTGKT